MPKARSTGRIAWLTSTVCSIGLPIKENVPNLTAASSHRSAKRTRRTHPYRFEKKLCGGSLSFLRKRKPIRLHVRWSTSTSRRSVLNFPKSVGNASGSLFTSCAKQGAKVTSSHASARHRNAAPHLWGRSFKGTRYRYNSRIRARNCATPRHRAKAPGTCSVRGGPWRFCR